MGSRRVSLGAVLAFGLGACRSGSEPVDRVLLVTIDTLRADRLGYMGYDVATPNLDRLGQEGVVFTEAVTAAPITLPSHASILSGVYPPTHGTRHNGVFRVDDGLETIAETLKREGFATAAFVGSFVLDRRFGLEQGFDHYDDELPEENPINPVYFAERRAEEVVARAVEWIEGRKDGPFFVWVHLFDPHAPHNPPPPFDERYPGRVYDAEIAYTDFALGPLFEKVDGPRTAIVVTADHGEGLGEHGESTHTLFVYDSTMKVPLLLKAPGVSAGTRVERQVRTVDIAPTILELANVRAPTGIEGESLLARLGGGDEPELAAYGETFGTLYQFNWSELRFLRKDGYKFIEAPRPELYDLGADPKELENLWSESPPEIGLRLVRELEAIPREKAATRAVDLDEETRRRLESLGYVSSGDTPPAAVPRADPPRTAARRADPKDRVEVFERMQDLLSPGLASEQQIEGYRAILELEPENTLARTRLAGLLAGTGRLEDAIEQYEELFRFSEIDINGLENVASALLLLDRTEEALKITSRAVAVAPWYRELQVLRAEALEHAGRLEEAIDSYGKAIELRPENPDNYWRRGTVALKLGDLDRAEGDFRESLARDPDFAEGRFALVRLLSGNGRAEEALELLSGMEMESAGAKVALAEAQIGTERFDAARDLLEQALALEPENTRALALLGPIYGRAGDLARAAATLEKAISLGETSPEIRRNLAVVFLQQGRAGAAIDQLREASASSPKDASVWFTLGNAYLNTRRGALAAEAYERALELRPGWPEATFNQAIAYDRAGAPRKAADAFRRFLAGEGAADPARREEAQKRLAALERQ